MTDSKKKKTTKATKAKPAKAKTTKTRKQAVKVVPKPAPSVVDKICRECKWYDENGYCTCKDSVRRNMFRNPGRTCVEWEGKDEQL